jgi:hypothetical protein
LQFLVDQGGADTYGSARNASINSFLRMNCAIHFVELDNRVISATYRNLMVKAKVVLVDLASGTPLPDPVTTITSPMPSGSLRIRLPEAIGPGTYFLMARNAHGQDVARSAEFDIE